MKTIHEFKAERDRQGDAQQNISQGGMAGEGPQVIEQLRTGPDDRAENDNRD